MYVGRIVAVGRTKDGRSAAMYRVSSRSFPNRTARAVEDGALIVPREGHQDDIYKNPYIAYRCIQIVGDKAVVSNGSQTDPIAEKISIGMPARDAMVSALLTLDYEKDDYNTPRIAGIVTRGGETALLGIVRKDGINVRELKVEPGELLYIATYEIDDVDPSRCDEFDADNAESGAAYVVSGGTFAELTNPVTSACAMESGDNFEIETFTPE